MRKWVSLPIDDLISFKKNLLHYANRFERSCVLLSNERRENGNEMIVGVDCISEIIPSENSFEAMKSFYEAKKDWLFGFLSYDLKNEIETTSDLPPLETSPLFPVHREGRERGVEFPLMHFFQPKYVFCLSTSPLIPLERGKKYKVEIGFLPEVSSEIEIENLFFQIAGALPTAESRQPLIELDSRVSREEYLRTIAEIKNHIQLGDIYEMNFCMEFFSVCQKGRAPSCSGEDSQINPAEVFLKLNETSQAPFSAFYRMNDNYLMCASPERFLKKEGRKIISQPIKGTARRGKDSEEDLLQKEKLLNSIKDRSENVMIVDLVRNDLSRTCNNVKVDDLFGVYSFKQWHQMISTVSGEMKEGVHFSDVIKNSFPMGSMTGAPKLSAMKLIERYEKTKRGLYSGTIGYITPEGNFDFNVVIRSILYNSSSKYLSFQVGSAITSNSIPEDEYEECLLKAKGMFCALGAENPNEHQNILF